MCEAPGDSTCHSSPRGSCHSPGPSRLCMRERCTQGQRRNLVRRESVCKYATQHIARYDDFMWKECGCSFTISSQPEKDIGLVLSFPPVWKIHNFLPSLNTAQMCVCFCVCVPFVCQNGMIDVTGPQLNRLAAARYLRSTPAGEQGRKTTLSQSQIARCQTSTFLANPSTRLLIIPPCSWCSLLSP